MPFPTQLRDLLAALVDQAEQSRDLAASTRVTFRGKEYKVRVDLDHPDEKPGTILIRLKPRVPDTAAVDALRAAVGKLPSGPAVWQAEGRTGTGEVFVYSKGLPLGWTRQQVGDWFRQMHEARFPGQVMTATSLTRLS